MTPAARDGILAGALFLVAATAPAAAEGGLAWAPLAGLDQPSRLRHEHLRRARCLPRGDDVTVPAYPDAVVIDLAWGRTAPACRARKGWQQLGAVALASADPPATVLAWYGERLGDYRRYEAAGRTIFIRAAIDDFLWERDYHKYPNIVVAQAPPPWLDAGYRTTIELNRPAAGKRGGAPDG